MTPPNICRQWTLIIAIAIAQSGCALRPFSSAEKAEAQEDSTPGWAPRPVVKGATGVDRRARDIERNLGYN